MEPFNLEEYLKNPTRPIVTRDGNRVRIVCENRKKIIALVNVKGKESVYIYLPNGRYCDSRETSLDLFFTPEPKTKKVGWMNVCKCGDSKHFSLVGGVIHPTREQALTERPNYAVDTIQIRWEE